VINRPSRTSPAMVMAPIGSHVYHIGRVKSRIRQSIRLSDAMSSQLETSHLHLIAG
jgi:hypothetical protein